VVYLSETQTRTYRISDERTRPVRRTSQLIEFGNALGFDPRAAVAPCDEEAAAALRRVAKAAKR
jgi:hypothetical protein